MTDRLDLEARGGLPDALRALLEDYPRAGWEADPHFEGLVRFWLERHLMFRRMMAAMREDTGRLLDGAIEERAYAARLSRIGSAFVGDLHGHHQIEDAHYFPALARAEPRIARGFEILDADHQALDGLLAAFTGEADGLLRTIAGVGGARDRAGRFGGRLERLERLLARHLTDEEELVVPVVLKHGPGGLG